MTQKLPRHVHAKKTSAVDVDKIGKFLRLALSSDHPGEVVAAMTALKRAMAASSLDLHDLAAAVEAGLRPAPQPSYSSPMPNPSNWQSMCWYAHFYRDQLRKDDAEFVADCLLGTAFIDTDGVVTSWHMERLRRIVASIPRSASAA